MKVDITLRERSDGMLCDLLGSDLKRLQTPFQPEQKCHHRVDVGGNARELMQEFVGSRQEASQYSFSI